MRTVHCVKLKRDLEGLETPPIRGELGEKIFNNVSKQAWNMWVEHSKMIVNEFRLSLASPEARALMRSEMEKYLFTETAVAPPPDFVPKT
jgi:Fe-S cluster biosynthesis and repair protein YggX